MATRRSLALTIFVLSVATAGCGESRVGSASTARRAGAATGAAKGSTGSSSVTGRSAAGSSVGSTRGTLHEVSDPQEASSFPAPAGTQHTAAAAPKTVAVAAGAPSDAEVQKELEQMKAVERDAAAARHQALKPVAGGESIGGDGTIPIPAGLPETVQKVIAGANEIADFPYVFGGGHASFVDNAYDCSGSVSYALAAGGLIGSPETSGELEHWGAPGPGRYITIYANAGHTYMYVDGILFDTAGRSGVYASRWQVTGVENSGFVARHPPGL
jgi:cell wall-associated NlpC family hydrolase